MLGDQGNGLTENGLQCENSKPLGSDGWPSTIDQGPNNGALWGVCCIKMPVICRDGVKL